MKAVLKVLIFLMLTFFAYVAYAADNYWDKQLLRAASSGDTQIVHEALSKGANPDSRDRFGNTPLILASDGGYQEILRLLLSKSASINAVNKYGYTALLSAVTNSHKEIAILLIRAGADVRITNKYDSSPKMYIEALGYKNIDEYVNNDKPSSKTNIDIIMPRRGAMAATQNAPWREVFNNLLAKGDTSEAANYLVGLAKQDNYEACLLLGELLIQKNNAEQGLDWLKKAAKSTNRNILFEIGNFLLSLEDPFDIKFAVDCITTAKNRGSIPAKIEYAKCLLFGIVVKKDYAQSYKLFSEAALLDRPEALFYQGYMQYMGYGVEQNEESGLKMITEAAKLGYDDAGKFVDRMNAENLIIYLNSVPSSERAKMKSYLASMNVPSVSSDDTCDHYLVDKAFNGIYGINAFDVCYLGFDKPHVVYRFKWHSDDEELDYLRNIAKDADLIVEEVK